MNQYNLSGACHRLKLDASVVSGVMEAVKQTCTLLRSMGALEKETGKGLLTNLGMENESDEERRRWGVLTFLLGIGLEHFGVRIPCSRKVWLGKGEQGSVAASAAILETPPFDPKRPFYIFAEMRATDWKTSCKEVTA